MTKETSRLFGEIIEEMKKIFLEYGEEKLIEDDDWCIYTSVEKLQPDTECYIYDYPDYDDETGEELLPEYAAKNKMKCVTTCEAIQDSVTNALEQRSDLTVERLIEAVNYYFDKLEFMKF